MNISSPPNTNALNIEHSAEGTNNQLYIYIYIYIDILLDFVAVYSDIYHKILRTAFFTL